MVEGRGRSVRDSSCYVVRAALLVGTAAHPPGRGDDERRVVRIDADHRPRVPVEERVWAVPRTALVNVEDGHDLRGGGIVRRRGADERRCWPIIVARVVADDARQRGGIQRNSRRRKRRPYRHSSRFPVLLNLYSGCPGSWI